MGDRIKAKGPHASPKARPRLTPNPGTFGINYLLLDRGGPWAWPGPGDPVARDLALTLQELSSCLLQDMLGRTRSGGDAANKEIGIDLLCPEAQERLPILLKRILTDVDSIEIFEFTYCYRAKDPRRIWTVYERDARLFFPVWWDPKHEVCGFDPAMSGLRAGGLHLAECPHPQEA